MLWSTEISKSISPNEQTEGRGGDAVEGLRMDGTSVREVLRLMLAVILGEARICHCSSDVTAIIFAFTLGLSL
jgi:hypothetical protein